MATPKIETLIERYKPTIVIVQLGTNWMDQTLSDDHIRHVLARFVSAVHGDSTRKIDLDRPAGFVAVFKGAESDLSADPAIGATGRSSDRFTSIHALCLGENRWRRDSLQRESGEAWAKPVNASH